MNVKFIFQYLILGLLLFFNTCNSPTEIISLPFNSEGQIESDMDNAILKPDGTVWTWGNNYSGQLGNGTTLPIEKPTRIANLKNVVAIDLCEGAAVAADIQGNIWFWGNRLIWEEPAGYDTTVVTPVKISFLSGAKQLQIISTEIRILKEDGTVWLLEWNHNTPTKYIYPKIIDGLNNIRMISDFLALKNDGEVCEFPENSGVGPEYGGLNDNKIYDVGTVQNVYMRYTILLKNDSTVWAWGKNKCGNLGNGSYKDNSVPTKIEILKNIISISANGSKCLALDKNGIAWFWGLIDLNIDENIEVFQNRPMKIEGITNIKTIHASPVNQLLLMKDDGTYWSYDLMKKEIKRIL